MPISNVLYTNAFVIGVSSTFETITSLSQSVQSKLILQFKYLPVDFVFNLPQQVPHTNIAFYFKVTFLQYYDMLFLGCVACRIQCSQNFTFPLLGHRDLDICGRLKPVLRCYSCLVRLSIYYLYPCTYGHSPCSSCVLIYRFTLPTLTILQSLGFTRASGG